MTRTIGSADTPSPSAPSPSAAERRNSWAKAPDFAGDPERAAAVARATAGDREHYLRGGMTEIECRSCHACVMVKKTSSYHTSVQWNSDARAKCNELEQLRRSGGNPALMPTCPRMSASINHGVAEGIIPAESPEVDPDGYW
ncbi:hypothetical protein [Gordonia sp. (in: high G+C Gram-positive bacteria)]|jgi:hypothetical protein|uniref:hypothetical protein n=2 Tax=Gordonia sp. (in: high G+C Gram-positive bacteria) TaxID=84139 RepID=UPI002613FE03|nr:hypothetical protein [Gordonia sp. (in: high G+C Gram-positive bacteria)]HMS77097.1 hypothetical protein [Gordonia sp. (in: high G+C Gram-positive bacteria)]HQV17248.1 hypothetical protein [Gordonia sp. (in: high G+C Gram-positive bacteria)]